MLPTHPDATETCSASWCAVWNTRRIWVTTTLQRLAVIFLMSPRRTFAIERAALSRLKKTGKTSCEIPLSRCDRSQATYDATPETRIVFGEAITRTNRGNHPVARTRPSCHYSVCCVPIANYWKTICRCRIRIRTWARKHHPPASEALCDYARDCQSNAVS